MISFWQELTEDKLYLSQFLMIFELARSSLRDFDQYGFSQFLIIFEQKFDKYGMQATAITFEN